MKLTNVNLLEKGKIAKLFASFAIFFFLFACGGGESQQQQDDSSNVSDDTTDDTSSEEEVTEEEAKANPYTGESITGSSGWKAVGPNSALSIGFSQSFGLNGELKLVETTTEASSDVFCWVTDPAYLQALSILSGELSRFPEIEANFSMLILQFAQFYSEDPDLTDADKAALAFVDSVDASILRTPLEELMRVSVDLVQSVTTENGDLDPSLASALDVTELSTFVTSLQSKIVNVSVSSQGILTSITSLKAADQVGEFQGRLISLANAMAAAKLADENFAYEQQVPCYYRESNNEFYCEVPPTAPVVCGLVDQETGSPYCTFDFSTETDLSSDNSTADNSATIPIMEISGADLTSATATVCDNGTATYQPDDVEASVSPSFKQAMEANFPSDAVVAALTSTQYDAYMIGFYDQASGQGGCFGKNCAGGEDRSAGTFLTEDGFSLVNNHPPQGDCFWDEGQQRNICPGDGDHFGGGDHYNDKFGFDNFDLRICNAGGYTIPKSIINNYAIDQNIQGFERAEAHFEFALDADNLDGGPCSVSDRDKDSAPCLVDIDVNVAGGEEGEEAFRFEDIALTGIEDSFLLKSVRQLPANEIVEEALRDWGNDWHAQRDEGFLPMSQPFLDPGCSPISLVNKVRQSFGFEALTEEMNDAYADFGQHHDPYGDSHYPPGGFPGDQGQDQQKICGVDAGDNVKVELATLGDLCLKKDDEGEVVEDSTGKPVIRTTADDFATGAFSTVFAKDSNSSDAPIYLGSDEDNDGVRDQYRHFAYFEDWSNNIKTIKDGCFADADDDGVLNYLDPYNNSDEGAKDNTDTYAAGGDADSDGILNWLDNCPFVTNADQTDTDSDSRGDDCETDGFVQTNPQVQFEFSWCTENFFWSLDDHRVEEDTDYTKTSVSDGNGGSFEIISFTDVDNDDIPDFLDSCAVADDLDTQGFFSHGDSSSINCVANNASDALKDIALNSAIAVCEAYENNDTVNTAAGNGSGICAPHHGQRTDENIQTCTAATSETTCWETGNGSCGWWWFGLREDLFVLREMGIDLSAARFFDHPDLGQIIAEINGGQQKPQQPQHFWPHNLDYTPLPVLDEYIEAEEALQAGWADGSDTHRGFYDTINRCRMQYSSGTKDLDKRKAYIAGIQDSLAKLNEITVGDTEKKKYICEQTDADGASTFNATVCDAGLGAEVYDEANGIECGPHKMTECAYRKLQQALSGAKERLDQWAANQAAVNGMYTYLENAVKSSSDNECLDPRLADTEEEGGADSELIANLDGFNAAFDEENDENLAKSQDRSFNNLRCIALDENVRLTQNECLPAPKYGKKDAFKDGITSEKVQSQLLVQEFQNPEDCTDDEFYNQVEGRCETEIKCRIPFAADRLCLDTVVGNASINGACDPEKISETIYMAGNKPDQAISVDGEWIHPGELYMQVIQMVGHEDLQTLFDKDICYATIDVPAYDPDGCWVYYDENNDLGDGTHKLYSSLSATSCETDTEAEDYDADCQSVTDYETERAEASVEVKWVRASTSEKVPLGNIAERNVMKMKLLDASKNQEAFDDWYGDFGLDIGVGGGGSN